jgi:hypothetical protein
MVWFTALTKVTCRRPVAGATAAGVEAPVPTRDGDAFGTADPPGGAVDAGAGAAFEPRAAVGAGGWGLERLARW